MNWRKKLYPDYKKKKKKIHPDDIAPEERYKNLRDAEQAKQDADMEEGDYLQDPENNTLAISAKDIEELTVKQNQQRDAAANAEFDRLIEEAKGLTGRAKAAKLKQAGRIREGNTGMAISEVPGAAWGAYSSFANNMLGSREEMLRDLSQQYAEFKLDTKVFSKGFGIGYGAGALTDIPGAGLVLGTAGGTTAVLGRRKVFDALEDILNASRYGKVLKSNTTGDEISPQYYMSQSKGAGSNKKTGKFLNTPDKVRRDILLNRKNPTLEELDQAVVRGGNEVQGWIYNRGSVTGFSDDLAKQLQKEFGGTDTQIKEFQNIQKTFKSKLQKNIKALNKKMQFDYLEFANTAVQEGERLGRQLTDEDIYEIFTAMAKNPKNADIFDLGHEISAKNVARQQRKGKLTTADYVSNMDIEIKKSIKDLIFRESKEGNIIPAARQPMITKTSAKDTNVLRNVEKGNIARGSRTDAPKVIQLLKGVSPNVETEYLRFLDPQFDKILTDIVPPDKHYELMDFIRTGIKQWQGKGKDRLIGKQQLDQYPQKLRQLVDDYLNLQDQKPYTVLEEDLDTIFSLNK